MAEKRMSCWQCRRYDRDERLCRDGKANPKRKTDTITVAEVLGLNALCHYNPYRDDLTVRMHFPKDPLAIRGLLPPRPSKKAKQTTDVALNNESATQGETA